MTFEYLKTSLSTDGETCTVTLCDDAGDAHEVLCTVTAGYAGTATGGEDGTATGGEDGTATAGEDGTATAGEDGLISILHHLEGICRAYREEDAVLELVDRYHADGAMFVSVLDGDDEHTVRVEDYRGELVASEAPEHVCEWVLAQDAITEFARVRIDAWLAD